MNQFAQTHHKASPGYPLILDNPG